MLESYSDFDISLVTAGSFDYDDRRVNLPLTLLLLIIIDSLFVLHYNQLQIPSMYAQEHSISTAFSLE